MKVVVEEILSDTGAGRALIVRRTDGVLQVEVERKVPGDAYEPMHWTRTTRKVVLADSLERARELAREELANLK